MSISKCQYPNFNIQMSREGELFILQRNAYIQYKYSIRRLKRAKYRKTFTKKCLNKWGDEFKEIKKFHGQSKTIQNSMV